MICSSGSKTVAFLTLGCKLNYAETSSYSRSFLSRGYRIVDFHEPSDVVVVNTCSVTENADKEARKLVRQSLRRSPNAFVIVLGCYAQLRPEEIASIEGVDLVLGATEKFRIFDYFKENGKSDRPKIFVGDTDSVLEFHPAFSSEHGDRTRAFLKIQDGCDYSCSFCTIPMARGQSRSAGVDDIIEQVEQILSAGFKEIVLSGVNVGDYGRKTRSSLYDLLSALLQVHQDYRLRISSIEPNLLDDNLIDLVASTEKICRHFHIPLQSGSTEILRSMKRRYDTDLYRAKVEQVKKRVPDCAIGVDVIVGFPGEKDRHFEETYRFLSELPVSYFHVFSYSERPGTPAAVIGETVPPAERAERSWKLRLLSEKKRLEFYEAQLGTSGRVLIESVKDDGRLTGFTSNYIRVELPQEAGQANQFVTVPLRRIEGGVVVPDPIEFIEIGRKYYPLPVLIIPEETAFG